MTISNFKGEGKWLSNFEPAEVELDGVMYPTVEHAYQAAKTTLREERQAMLACETPGKARKLGQKVTIRPDWNKMKVTVMYILILQKFSRHEHLKQKLLATEDHHLVEDSTGWDDRFWGVSEGRGRNHLGRILMDVREELRAKENLQFDSRYSSEGASALGVLWDQINRIVSSVEKHKAQTTGHNMCWENDVELWRTCGLGDEYPHGTTPPWCEFMQRCAEYRASREKKE